MSHLTIRRIAFVAAVLLVPITGHAQQRHATVQPVVNIDKSDSLAWVMKRENLRDAIATLQTRQRTVALVLNDTALVMQLTDHGLDGVADSIRSNPGQPGGKVFASILSAGVTALLDHGIAFRLSGLREARMEGGTLVIETLKGDRLFNNVDVNDRQVVDDFPPAEAERFVSVLNRAIRRQR